MCADRRGRQVRVVHYSTYAWEGGRSDMPVFRMMIVVGVLRLLFSALWVERRFFQMMIVVGVLLLFSDLWEGGEIQREREGGRNMLRRKRSEFGEKTKEVEEEEEEEGFLVLC